jgi:IclR family acetate operon transcriptional repressor
VGVNCVAVPVHVDGSMSPVGAISLSAVTFRCPVEQLIQAVPDIRATIRAHLGQNALG